MRHAADSTTSQVSRAQRLGYLTAKELVDALGRVTDADRAVLERVTQEMTAALHRDRCWEWVQLSDAVGGELTPFLRGVLQRDGYELSPSPSPLIRLRPPIAVAAAEAAEQLRRLRTESSSPPLG
jgi:hypothetical protein